MVKKRIIHKKKKLHKKAKIKLPKLSINLSILKTKQSIWILTTLLILFLGILFYQVPIFKTNTQNVLTNVQQSAVFRSPNSFYIPNLIILVLILASLVIIIQRSIKLYKVSKQK